jgi:peptidoglycan/LPS O-acetylase OafA/YrhL
MSEPRPHLPEIDWLKGFAIVAVVCIHAQLWAGTFIFHQLIDRAVMIFMVLFGVSSELWWQREQTRRPETVTRRWYSGRLKRILPGYWAIMAAWWLAVALWGRPEHSTLLGWRQVLASFLAYAPFIGTSWFVAVILQYILVYPALRRAPRLISWPLTLAIAALTTWASGWWSLDIVDAGKALVRDRTPGLVFYYRWIFAPRVLFHVVVGLLVARWWGGRVSRKATLIALGLSAVGIVASLVARGARNDVYGPMRELSIAQLVDVPVAIALLGLFRWVPPPERVRGALAWCGLHSWGIYLAHLLVHELTEMAGFDPEPQPQLVRALYALFLLASGVVLAGLAARITAHFSPKERPTPS